MLLQSGRVCSLQLWGSDEWKSLSHRPRSHLVRLPGQVGVPTDGDNLDDGQPTTEGSLNLRGRVISAENKLLCCKLPAWSAGVVCWLKDVAHAWRHQTAPRRHSPVMQRNEVEVGDLDGGPQLENRPQRPCYTRKKGFNGWCNWKMLEKTYVVIWDQRIRVVLSNTKVWKCI